jgi:hypothetical protein
MQTFGLDRGMATRFSRYFWNRCYGPSSNPAKRDFHCAALQPVTFGRFLEWITSRVPTKPPQDRFNLELYDLACRLDVPLLINELTEEFRLEFLTNFLYADDSLSKLQRLGSWLWVKALTDEQWALMTPCPHHPAGVDRRFL